MGSGKDRTRPGWTLPETKTDATAQFDQFVTENRFTIAVVFPLVGAVTLLASAEGVLPDPLAFNPYFVLFGTFVMRLPLVAGVFPLVDRRAGLALVALTLYSYGIELVGVRTGWPYGEFTYGVDLGPMLLGEVPFGLPVFFFPLVLNAYLLVLLLLGNRAASTAVRLLATLSTVMLIDLVLDPGAVAIGFWTYEVPQFYGVPWQNYAGWLLSGSVAVLLFDLGFDRAGLRQRLEACPFMLDDLVSFVLLWGGINLFYANWVPVGIAALLGAGLLWTDRFDFDLSETRVGRAVWR
ncbi:carotene biosynthesis protein [Haloarcula taiwanensis]|uniref:Carotene biosynthesis protein n=1 Tax=Haloarcula taiwanensis TaxID=1932004 RepID=A0A2H4ZWW0_9EURY|nr:MULTISPECIES: bisanhydrobacterioruberin hydratase [Haloarcula]AUG46942.1 carotene biosynthesis protein [Haloarcula taiwanensis]RLM37146.1 carotenoid biosynthesis protein [Haloarcula sp. Atlit-120R]RLM44464.1 carotenoid biosynthesis protein [Haloarcula sp. Atlit-47R]